MKERTAKNTYTRRIAFALSAALSLFCLVAAAEDRFFIEPGVENGTIKPPVIVVKAVKDQTIYDTVDVKQGTAGDLNFSIKLRGHCPEQFHMASGGLWVYGKTKQRDETFHVNTDHRSIGAGHGAEWFYYRFSVPFVMPTLDRSPVDVCNSELQRAGSQSARAKLLQEGFSIDFARAYRIEFQTLCDRTDLFHDQDYAKQADTFYPATVRCMPTDYHPQRTPVPPQRTPVPDPPIESVSVIADPAETQGRQCPVYVNFKGKITAGEHSQFGKFNTKYRFIGEDDFKTDWLPTSVLRGEPRTVYGRRYIQAPTNEPGGTLKAAGGRVKIPIHHGWMALEVMLPNGTKRSERTSFSVDCNVQPRIRARS
jgi:hypothetical protein